MEYVLVLVATPLAVWAIDRWFYRGEFTALVREALGEERARRAKPVKRPRVRANRD